MVQGDFYMRSLSGWFACCIALALGACAGFDKPKPEPLEANPASLAVKEVWRVNMGATASPLEMRAVGATLWAAAIQGDLSLIDASSGQVRARASIGQSLSAGVGADKQFVAVVSRDNQLIVQSEQKEIWRQKIPSLVVTAPLVAGERVFVLAADRTVYAFDAANGRKLWTQQRSGESLLLGQAGLLTAVGDTLLAAQGGRLLGLNPQNGSLRWDVQVASGRGVNEVERLADLVSGVSRVDYSVCLRSFQYAVACIDARTGRSVWNKSASGASGVSGDAQTVFGTDSDGKVIAWRRADGEKLWTNEKLRFRGVTGPTLAGGALLLGDGEGNLHFLSPTEGKLLNRLSTDGSPIVSAPIWLASTWVVVTQRGNVIGFRLQ
jgi:outer membrane protein assembly factor BamB